MLIDLLHQVLQINRPKRWQFVIRLQNLMKISQIKSKIIKEVSDNTNICVVVKNFCYIIETSLDTINIDKPDDVSCGVIYYEKTKDSISIIQFTTLIDNILYEILIEYRASENGRIRAKISPIYGKYPTHDFYIYADLSSSHTQSTLSRKKLSILNTVQQQITLTLIEIIDTIYDNNIKSGGKVLIHEDGQKEVRQSQSPYNGNDI